MAPALGKNPYKENTNMMLCILGVATHTLQPTLLIEAPQVFTSSSNTLPLTVVRIFVATPIRFRRFLWHYLRV